MHHFAGIGFVVAFGLFLELFFDVFSTFAKRFIPYLACLKRLLVLFCGASSCSRAAFRMR
uniref:hypothetical protein n=1 Tax=Neisseria canis TaxID=493 RepID=UPI001E610B45|nr:hypothetical protein [Neisseria canis]